VKVAQEHLQDGIPMLALETALPAKFGDVIREAIGQDAPVPEHLRSLADLPQRVDVLDCNADSVRAFLQARALR